MIRPEQVAAEITRLIKHPDGVVFVPRVVQGPAVARRLLPRTFARGLKVYGRLGLHSRARSEREDPPAA